MNQAQSSTEYATPTTTTISNGREVGAATVLTQWAIDFDRLDLRMEPGDVLAFTIVTISGTSAVGLSVDWHEE